MLSSGTAAQEQFPTKIECSNVSKRQKSQVEYKGGVNRNIEKKYVQNEQ